MNSSLNAALMGNNLTAVRPGAADRLNDGLACGGTTFDGIICFGGVDWWYHNRGHYDLQMMRELSAAIPILYVNSIGMRLTSAGPRSNFFRRVRRKLASVARGRVQVRANMTVFSPFAPPVSFGRSFLRRGLTWQVQSVSRSLGIHHPLVWVACPPAADVLDALKPRAVVYQRTDRYENYPGVEPLRIVALDRALKTRAELTLFCSSMLLDEERQQCRHALFVDHGVDFALFAEASLNVHPPAGLATLPSPRIGYVGNLEPHRVDHALLSKLAHLLPEFQFVIVGPGALDSELSHRPNVHHFPQQPYEDVAAFMAACDVLIMPWNDNAWIRACNPVKLKEYLATGRPIVSTPFEELRRYEGFVHVARGAEMFAARIRAAVQSPDDPWRLRNRVRHETWETKAHSVLEALRQQNVHYQRLER